MAGKYLIGIDNGTQSTKVVIYDLAGNVVCDAKRTLLPMEHPEPGYAVHPDDDLWESIVAASREVMTKFPGDPADILGVGLCTIRCCKAFLKADGTLLEPVMSWMDTRAYQPWIPDDPELAYATTSSGYMTHRFTGQFRDSAANNIILQWPIDTDTWQWDPALFEQFNMRPELLVELQMPGDIAGYVTADAAAATGIPEGLPVVTTANDKAVEALGSGSLDERTALVSLGTYIASMVHGHENRQDAVEFWTNFACIPGTLPLRERRRAPRHVDAQLVPRPARAGVRRGGGEPGHLARGVPRARGRAGPRRELRPHDGPGLARPHATSPSARARSSASTRATPGPTSTARSSRRSR